MKTRSSIDRTGGIFLLEHVYLAPMRSSSLRAAEAIKSLKVIARDQQKLGEDLSWGCWRRLKSPPTRTGCRDKDNLSRSWSKNRGDREWSEGPYAEIISHTTLDALVLSTRLTKKSETSTD